MDVWTNGEECASAVQWVLDNWPIKLYQGRRIV